MHKSIKKHQYLRKMVQCFVLGLFIVISINAILFDINKSSLPSISLQSFCPFGGVTALYTLFTTGMLISVITVSIVIVTFLLGTVFCGWICPFGTLQDLISSATKKVHIKSYNHLISTRFDRYLRLARYAMLTILIYFSIQQIVSEVHAYCIYHAVLSLGTNLSLTGGLIILAGVIISTAFFIERPWCKYLCPYGALLGIMNKFSLFTIRRKASQCLYCKKCDNICPMNIHISKKTSIRDIQCISCLKCTSESHCPIKDEVIVESGIRPFFSIKHKTLALFTLILVVGSISLGYFEEFKGWEAVNETINKEINLLQQKVEIEDGKGLKYMDGIYEGLAVAYRPGLRVLVTIESDKIIDIEIISHRESRGYFEESFEVIPQWIMDKQSTQVDSISGATKTGDGIKKAVENALKKAEINAD